MSNTAIFITIVFILAIILGNLLLIKKSAKFEIKKKDDPKPKDPHHDDKS